jgi:hypothetical protein
LSFNIQLEVGDDGACIKQCQTSPKDRRLAPKWVILNLLLALYAKVTWDDEADYYFYAAGAAITRQEVKLEYLTDT